MIRQAHNTHSFFSTTHLNKTLFFEVFYKFKYFKIFLNNQVCPVEIQNVVTQ